MKNVLLILKIDERYIVEKKKRKLTWWVKLVSMGGVDYRAKWHKPLYALIENDLHNYGNIKNILMVEMF
jgi:hypothetical protein